jgi:TATA-box binding protein (TBP) (component of TFIID and TFIIIB)
MEVTNVVSSITYDGKFILEHVLSCYGSIAKKLHGFPAIVLKLGISNLCHVFPNGKVIVLGATSIKQCHEYCDRYTKLLQDIGYDKAFGDIRVVNIVARYTHRNHVGLFSLAESNRLEYEPELFPAVRLRYADLGITIIYSGLESV